MACGWLSIRPAFAYPVISDISARSGHTATLLHNGNILVVGGVNASGTPSNSVEMVLASSWTVTANNTGLVARTSHTATLLPNGEVLVVGGWSGAAAVCSAQVYNPELNCWHAAINSNCNARFDHTATLLLDGTVLICGGRNSLTPTAASLDVCDIFTPEGSASACGASAGSFSGTHPTMHQGRSQHTATKLSDEATDTQGGRVFFAGGFNGALDADYQYLTTTEIYDNGVFKPAYPLSQARAQHTATMMGHGKVLIVGGFDGLNALDNLDSGEPVDSISEGFIRSTEIYDPVGDNMVYGDAMDVRLRQHTATLQASGLVEAIGGLGNFNNAYPDADASGNLTIEEGDLRYDPATSRVRGTTTITPTGSDHLLKDWKGKRHNVTGDIVEGSLYFRAIASSPTIAFADGNKVEFDPGIPDTREGLFIDLANTKVSCPEDDTQCGRLLYPEFSPTDDSGTVTLSPSPTWPMNPSIRTGSKINYNAFPASCPNGNEQDIIASNTTMNIRLEFTGLGAEFEGSTLQNVTVDVPAGEMDVTSYSTGDPGIKIKTNAVTVTLPNAAVTGTAETNDLKVTFDKALTTEITGHVYLSTDGCVELPARPMDISDTTLWTALNAIRITHYEVDKLSLKGQTLKSDRTVLIVNKMVFADLQQYKANQGPDNWSYPATGHDPQFNARFGHSVTLTPRGASFQIGGTTCDPATAGSCALQAQAGRKSFTWTPDKTFEAGASMSTKRALHTATTLPSGRILVAGGTNGPNVLRRAELLDPMGGIFVPTGEMNDVRDLHTATLLPNGRVLVAGGYSTSKLSTGAIQAAEIYYPDTGLWLPTSVMVSSRSNHTATVLPDGNVLVLGGYARNEVIKTAEIYYSTAGVWRRVQDLPEGRYLHTATLLRDGRVLMVGGQNETGMLATTQIFDPSRGCWEGPGRVCNANGGYAAALPGSARRRYHSATLLMDGRVLVAGGNDGNWEVDSVFLYDPLQNRWATGEPLTYKRQSHTATLLPNGAVLVAGGAQAVSAGGLPSDKVEQYDPQRDRWVYWSLSTRRAYHTMTMGTNGTLFLIGGFDGSSYLASVETHGLYSSQLDEFSVDQPSTRRAQIYGTDLSVIDPRPRDTPTVGDVFTATGTHFHGLTEASGGASGPANSDHRHPRLLLQSVDGSGGGASQSNSGFIVDLTTRIAVNAGDNVWSLTDASVTVRMPSDFPTDGILAPLGWYHLRAGANDQLSVSRLLRVGPHLPSAPVDSLGAYNAAASPSTVGLSSVTFSWNTPAGLTPGEDFDGYNVYVATTGVFISTRPDEGGADGCPAPETPCNFITIQGLPASTTQTVVVSPYNISGDYDGTPVSSAAWTLPNEPLDVVIATASGSSFYVKWSTMVSGNPINGEGTLYEAFQSLKEDFSTIIETFTLTRDNFVPDSPLSLTANVRYFFRVRA
ncbi:MAG: kelch repeat-containing protein, partial [Elusimicrobia bacterium]|nr:kelch repeat-containing protein [Elusimicrobiota bacterium]